MESEILTYKNYKKYSGTYSIGTFQNHFESWQNAVEKIGLKDGHLGKYSNEELFVEMQNLWERLGKEPTFKQMNELGRISGGVYQRKFGSWSKAIHAFCADRESDGEFIDEGDNILTHPKEHIIEFHEQNNSTPPKQEDDYIIVTTPRTPSIRLRFQVLKRDEFKCAYCGKSPATHPGLSLEIDHIHPYSKGGETVLKNLQTLCSECNLGKSDSVVS